MEDQYIGKLLDDRYEILSVLGAGGMSVVYRAKCHRLNRMVAVKILRPEMAEDEEIRNRFHDESQAVAMMSHPNIVSVYDVSQSEGVEYIVMELIEGITLKQYMLKRGKPLNWREALHFANQIFQALKHAHSRGIIHRDIKPQNIMVLRDGSVKVADFGIARISDSQRTLTTETLGSVHYIAPEQARGGDVDCRSDLYSAGVVLYEMLTGRLPFEGDSAIAVALQHINSIPLEPRELVADIPEGMEQITMHCMDPDRERRYANADEVLQDLDSFRRNPGMVFPYETPWHVERGETPHTPEEQTRIVDPGRKEPEKAPEQPAATEPEKREHDDQDRGKRRAVAVGTVLLLVAVVALLVAVIWNVFLAGLFSGSESYKVPSLLGMTQAEAQQYILEHEEYNGHFTVLVSEDTVYDANYKVGEIVSQTPRGGSTTKSESTGIVVILCGEEPVEEEMLMPNIVGGDYGQWATMLEDDYGVVVRYTGQNSDQYEAGQIISTDPVAGTPLTKGQSVMLYYSKGAATKKVPMISVQGLTLEKATEKLKAIGLEVGDTQTVESDQPKGTVVYQSVPTSTEVNEGTAVNLHISSGPREEEPPISEPLPQETHRVVITMPEGRTEDAYVVVRVPTSENPVYEGSLKPDETRLTLTVQGSVEGLTVTVDGEDYTDFTVD